MSFLKSSSFMRANATISNMFCTHIFPHSDYLIQRVMPYCTGSLKVLQDQLVEYVCRIECCKRLQHLPQPYNNSRQTSLHSKTTGRNLGKQTGSQLHAVKCSEHPLKVCQPHESSTSFHVVKDSTWKTPSNCPHVAHFDFALHGYGSHTLLKINKPEPQRHGMAGVHFSPKAHFLSNLLQQKICWTSPRTT